MQINETQPAIVFPGRRSRIGSRALSFIIGP